MCMRSPVGGRMVRSGGIFFFFVIVTERVMESFSEDDCEPEPHAQPSPKKAPPSLQKANQTIDSKKGTKQASLTSFFIK